VDARTITNAALDVLDESGLDKLSMRLVAARLGVQAGGLYYYVADKAALLRAMADVLCDQALAETGGPPASGSPGPAGDGLASWAVAAAQLMGGVRTVLNRHRDSARILAASPLNGSLSALALMDRLIAILETGLDAEAAAIAADTLMAYVTGFVLQEQSGAPAPFTLTMDELTARFPRVMRAAAGDDDEEFTRAVHAIIAGFRDRD
jgi:TetR/AcrR family tetracycline transcriptional repressor